jgi:hypothetical protein
MVWALKTHSLSLDKGFTNLSKNLGVSAAFYNSFGAYGINFLISWSDAFE